MTGEGAVRTKRPTLLRPRIPPARPPRPRLRNLHATTATAVTTAPRRAAASRLIWMSCGATSTASSRACSAASRSEEHTSELQSQSNLVCRLLLEKKKTLATHPRKPARKDVHPPPARPLTQPAPPP